MTRYQRKQWESACRRWQVWQTRQESPPRREWTEADESFLRKFYDARGALWCGARLHRSADSVRWHVMVMRARDSLAEFSRLWLA